MTSATRRALTEVCDLLIRADAEPDAPVPIAFPNPSPSAFARRDRIKRAADVVLSLLIGILALPVLGISILLVRLTSRGSAVYRQIRVGLDGTEFAIYKIRSMYVDAELRTGPQWATENDPRVTPVGRILRKSHLDELPQLWNILKGDMSLVGPRPERPAFTEQLERAIPRYRERLKVRPGLTGLAQIQLPPDSDLESVRRKLACDLYYVARGNLWFDLRAVLVTALGVLGVPHPTGCRVLGIPSPAEIDQVRKLVEAVADRAVERLPDPALDATPATET